MAIEHPLLLPHEGCSGRDAYNCDASLYISEIRILHDQHALLDSSAATVHVWFLRGVNGSCLSMFDFGRLCATCKEAASARKLNSVDMVLNHFATFETRLWPTKMPTSLQSSPVIGSKTFSVRKCSTGLLKPLFASPPIQASSLHSSNLKRPRERP